MKPILSAAFSMLAAYTYTITMEDNVEVIYVVTNLISFVSWLLLGILIFMSRRRYAGDTFTWVRPLSLAFKFFCALSAVRYLLNDLVIWFPKLLGVQSVIFVLNNLALAVAVGYASVYYRKLPVYLIRARRHQALSRRYDVIGDITVDAFLEVDGEGYIYYANRGAGEMFNCPKGPPDLLGQNIVDDLMASATKADFLTLRNDYRKTHTSPLINRREPVRVELLRHGGSGETFPAEMTVSEYELSGTKRFCLIVRDISYRVHLEDKIREVT